MSDSTNQQAEHANRDAASLKILGTFFAILSVLVLAGVAWNLDDSRAIVVTIVCGCILLAVGIGMIRVGQRTGNRNSGIDLGCSHENAEEDGRVK